jgi:hypothetical protein
MEKKNSNKHMYIFYLFLILFVGWVLSQFILINQDNLIMNEITGYLVVSNPFKDLGNFLNTNISIGGESLPLWGVILTFALLFSVIFVLAKKIHLFKDEESKGPAIVFSLAVSLLTVFFTPISGVVIYLASFLGYFIIIIALLLLGWAGYLGLHKSVSSGVGEINEIAAERYKSKQTSKEAKGAYFKTVSAYETAKQERNILKDLKDKVYNKDTKAIRNLLILFDNLTNKQSSINDQVNRILNRISSHEVPRGNKQRIDTLVKEIRNLEKGFESKVKEIRNAVEQVKAAIKTNEFATAASNINKALNLEQELESITKTIARNEDEINNILK